MIRNVLLWASENPWLARTLPRKRFVQRAVRRFMPGDGRGDALAAAEELRGCGIGTVFTLLGENVVTPEGVAEVLAEYRDLLDEIREKELDGEISVKLTQLGLDQGVEPVLSGLRDLVGRAAEIGSFVWIDMEGSAYRERTLEVFSRIVGESGPERIGLCLQAYLRATPGDLEGLLPLSPVIRIVKGAYAEPADLAFPDRRDVDEAFFQLGVRLLGSVERGAFATHDPALIRRLRDRADSPPALGGRFEFQMLYGIRTEEQLRLAREGAAVRVLVSYGPAWFPWYMRRLAERPANVWFVVKNVFRG